MQLNQNSTTQSKEWFESWFDSPYHGMLYKHRNEVEAKKFIDRLFDLLQPSDADKVIDIACGDGRHAAYMSHFVGEVVGIDLSPRRIAKASQIASNRLRFCRHDMRVVFKTNYFDFGFNFFTSFGYFQTYEDNILAAQAMADNLKPGGILMIDYMNVDTVKKHLVAKEHVHANDIDFEIERKSQSGKIIKTIKFKGKDGEKQQFEEVVSEFRLSDFQKIFATASLQLLHTFGDYNLAKFIPSVSPRLIMIFKKPQ
jgi:SAM-dependent methyltransferase